jgi:NAD(P)-dependent dehydrogenase (short-subunit alcohol dehydrogenase family)
MAGNPEDVVKAFAQIKEALGDPEVLIYNAGPSIG